MIFSRCMRASWVAYCAKQLVEPVFLHEPFMGPIGATEASATRLHLPLTAAKGEQPY